MRLIRLQDVLERVLRQFAGNLKPGVWPGSESQHAALALEPVVQHPGRAAVRSHHEHQVVAVADHDAGVAGCCLSDGVLELALNGSCSQDLAGHGYTGFEVSKASWYAIPGCTTSGIPGERGNQRTGAEGYERKALENHGVGSAWRDMRTGTDLPLAETQPSKVH